MQVGDLVLWKTNCTYSFNNELLMKDELVIIYQLWTPDPGFEWSFCEVMKSNGEIVSGVHILELEPINV